MIKVYCLMLIFLAFEKLGKTLLGRSQCQAINYFFAFDYLIRSLGAKKVTIAEEAEKLRQLEAAVFNDFRRDIRKRLRMQTMKVRGQSYLATDSIKFMMILNS